jgi:hypothetical protein
MRSRMGSLVPLAAMLAGATLAMALIGAVAGRLEAGEPSTTSGRTTVAGPAR